MKNVKQLNEKIEQILQKQQLNEMSIGWGQRLKGKNSVCAWIEGPLRTDNRYFKYYNNMYYEAATKVARIRLDRPEYVGGVHKEGNKKKWVLTKSEISTLLGILQSPSRKNPKYTNWQIMLLIYNENNFYLYEPITGNLEQYKDQKAPYAPKDLLPFPIDFPMSDYSHLIMD